MSETLESVRRAAQAHRRGGGRRLPDELKRRAVGLLERHSAQAVATAVGVSNRSVVKRWRRRFGSGPTRALATRDDRTVGGFVEVSALALGLGDGHGREAEVNVEVDVEVVAAQGHRLRLRGRLGAEAGPHGGQTKRLNPE
jgi:transposase-like protein